jgi:hypothetical protein
MSRLGGRALLSIGVALAAATAAVTVIAGGTAPASALGASTPHLVVVMLENKEYSSVVGNANAPYLNQTLIPQGRLFTSYYSSTHPSLPNYLTITSAEFGGCITDACPYHAATQDNLFAQMDRATPAISWRVYAEDMPSNCYTHNTTTYVVRHNPPLYYANLPTCATNDVPYSALAGNLSAGTLPQFAMLIPNLYDDMHTDQNAAPCNLGSATQDEVCQGDTWLRDQLPAVLSDGGRNDVTALIVFDEGGTNQGGGGHVLLLEVGPNTCTGCTDSTPYSERSLADAIDDWFGLPHLQVTPPSF